MKTLEQIKAGYISQALDGRDITRLARFFPLEDLAHFELEVKNGVVHAPVPFTRENVLAALKNDVEFGFEKALSKRGISAGLMFICVQMWNWVLEEGLESYNEETGYVQYGLPLFKATAVKYGFPNPIGTDDGDEPEYTSD